MKLLQFVIIRLTLCTVIGIILSLYVSPYTTLLTYSLITLIVVFIGLSFLNRKSFTLIYSSCVYLIFTLLICVFTILKTSEFQKHHFSKRIDGNTNYSSTLKIQDVLKPTSYYNRYYAEVLSINDKPTTGRVLIYLKKSSKEPQLNIDDIIVSNCKFKSISPPLNPSLFNYKQYLKQRYISYSTTLNPSQLKVTNVSSTSIYGFANSIRTHIIEKLNTYPFSKKELAIINALLLGERQYIDKTTFTNYSNAGAIHILAISGLHIGILLFILNFIFSPLKTFKNGTLIKTFIIVGLLWCIAFITGLSPSVVRATTMFSIIQLATLLKRPTNIYNTIALSAFVLLVIRPMYLFDVGFQLSYAAVIAIVTIHPLFIKLWRPKHRIVRYFWSLFALSIAAQIGVLPLSLFYFHKFTGLFWLTNLIIIPFVSVILSVGIFIICLALCNLLPSWVVKIYDGCIETMNAIIAWIGNFDAFIIERISFTLIQVLTSYAFIFCCTQFALRKRHAWLVYALCFVIGFQTEHIITKSKSKDELIVFHKYKSTAIGIKKKSNLSLYSDVDSLSALRFLNDYRMSRHIKNTELKNMTSVFKTPNKHLLVVDSLGIYNTTTFKPKSILLRTSPKINLDRLIDTVKPKLIIADGSNYNSYIKRWKATCRKRNIPFHSTNEKGCYMITLN